MTNTYPGDAADPKDVALWMAKVAEEEYGIPGILPVMTSCVEITDAWTGPGDVRDVLGYLSAVDHTSVGYFQQQNNWGTYAQRTDANWALRAFLTQAKRIEDDSPADTPEQLGAWCAAVQRPREDLEYLYADKGYPMAAELLKGAAPSEYATAKVGFDGSGWAIELETSKYLRASSLPNLTLYTDASGWLYRKGEGKKKWGWPPGDEPVGYLGDGSYRDYHPDRYDNVWRSDIETLARKVVDAFPGNVWANTYYQHPPGWNRDDTSVDFWAYAGRGKPIGHEIGQQVFDYIFNDPNPPWIEWCIWEGWIWTSAGEWSLFNDDGTGLHFDHCHFTFS